MDDIELLEKKKCLPLKTNESDHQVCLRSCRWIDIPVATATTRFVTMVESLQSSSSMPMSSFYFKKLKVAANGRRQCCCAVGLQGSDTPRWATAAELDCGRDALPHPPHKHWQCKASIQTSCWAESGVLNCFNLLYYKGFPNCCSSLQLFRVVLFSLLKLLKQIWNLTWMCLSW